MKLSEPADMRGVIPFVSTKTAAMPLKVLIASSEEQPHIYARSSLSRTSWIVCSRFRYDEALNLLTSEPFAVVLCDTALTGGSWETLLAVSRELPRPPHFLAFSHSADENLWAEALNLGAYDLLEYPFVDEQFLHVVGLACDSWVYSALRPSVCQSIPQSRAATSASSR